MRTNTFKTLALCAALAAAAVACDKENNNNAKPDDNNGNGNTTTTVVIAVTGVTLSKTTAELAVGDTLRLTATVAPDSATNKAVTWTSSNTSVATIVNGRVTAVSVGSAAITVKTQDGGKTATCEITVSVKEIGVIINGRRWATRNVNRPGTFAANPEDAGMLYQWNRRVGWSSSDPLVNSNGGTTWDTSDPTKTLWTTENNPCPEGWRLPTNSDFMLLRSSGSTYDYTNGVEGYFFGNEPNQIFLPSVSPRRKSDGVLESTTGFYQTNYWINTFSVGNPLVFGWPWYESPHNSATQNEWNSAKSVRCVQ